MFERFTPRAKQAITLAQREAIDLSHDFIGTEHMLLGLIGTDDGIAHDVLAEHGVTIERAREQAVRLLTEGGITPRGPLQSTQALAAIGIDVAEIRKLADESFGPGKFQFPRPGFTPRAKRTLEMTLRTAKSMRAADIGSEHLLLALLDDPDGVGYHVLRALDVDPVALRATVLSRAE